MLDISWSNILNSNAFNFTILVIFFAILMKYLKLPEAMAVSYTHLTLPTNSRV